MEALLSGSADFSASTDTPLVFAALTGLRPVAVINYSRYSRDMKIAIKKGGPVDPRTPASLMLGDEADDERALGGGAADAEEWQEAWADSDYDHWADGEFDPAESGLADLAGMIDSMPDAIGATLPVDYGWQVTFPSRIRSIEALPSLRVTVPSLQPPQPISGVRSPPKSESGP